MEAAVQFGAVGAFFLYLDVSGSCQGLTESRVWAVILKVQSLAIHLFQLGSTHKGSTTFQRAPPSEEEVFRNWCEWGTFYIQIKIVIIMGTV